MTVPIINALLLPKAYWAQALIANTAIIGVLFVLERGWGFKFEQSRRLTYDRIELIDPARYDELLGDVVARTGLPLTRIEVGTLDFLRDSAELKLYYPAVARSKRTAATQQVVSAKSNQQTKVLKEIGNA